MMFLSDRAILPRKGGRHDVTPQSASRAARPALAIGDRLLGAGGFDYQGYPVGGEYMSEQLTEESRELWAGMAAKHVRSFLPPGFPTIICLCGSTRFKEAWYAETKRLTHAGYIVLGVGDLDCSEAARSVNVPLDPALKARLDELHLCKIDLADEVMILNVGGYVGQSTRREINHAHFRGKPVHWLEQPQ
jgi:hypothetical protein